MNRIANQVTRLLSAFPGEGDEAVTAAVAAARPSIGGASDERLEGRQAGAGGRAAAEGVERR